MNLRIYFNDFALPSWWNSCAKEQLHVSNESCSSLQINLFCRANQFTLQRKSICFTEQINLLCIRICCIFIWNICFSTYYTAPATQSTIVRKQEGCHDFSADKRGGYLPLMKISTPLTLINTKSLCCKKKKKQYLQKLSSVYAPTITILNF